MNLQPPEELQNLLHRLTLEQLEQALGCLYNAEPPSSPVLQDLAVQQWALLSGLLVLLLQEREQSSLH